LKASFENEKRRLFGFIAEHFATDFDPRNPVDSQAFRQIIEKASAEWLRLESLMPPFEGCSVYR
jgi:hypothetical protein